MIEDPIPNDLEFPVLAMPLQKPETTETGARETSSVGCEWRDIDAGKWGTNVARPKKKVRLAYGVAGWLALALWAFWNCRSRGMSIRNWGACLLGAGCSNNKSDVDYFTLTWVEDKLNLEALLQASNKV